MVDGLEQEKSRQAAWGLPQALPRGGLEWPLQGHFLRHHEPLKQECSGSHQPSPDDFPRCAGGAGCRSPQPQLYRQNIPELTILGNPTAPSPSYRCFLDHLAGGSVYF